MLLDNNKFIANSCTVADFIRKNVTDQGTLDIVTGYFSVAGLNHLYLHTNQLILSYKLIIGDMAEQDNKSHVPAIILINDLSIEKALLLPDEAQKAIEFLKQRKVEAKTLKPDFCHAKVYIYGSNQDSRHNFFILGSSNLTSAGLGLNNSFKNIELNIAETGDTNNLKNTQTWFREIWKAEEAKSTITIDNRKQNFKDYLIAQIQQLQSPWTPEEIYHKILFTYFYDNLNKFENDPIQLKQIKHLEETVIFNSLYPFQQQGAISIIHKLQRFNGAILADAVGLGKTWQALAVMKFFEMQGYKIILICPKKLESNWKKYRKDMNSLFEPDELDYWVLFHTNLPDENTKDYGKVTEFFNRKHKQKVLFVIDESHNFRNDKTTRYKKLTALIQNKKDTKVLLLSATPINNKLADIRNQFKLLAGGKNEGFKDIESIEIPSLERIFMIAEQEFGKWEKSNPKKINVLINNLPPEFINNLCDNLIVARTRESIAKHYDSLKQDNNFTYPAQSAPENYYIAIKNLGKLTTNESIAKLIVSLSFAVYRPAEFMDVLKKGDFEYNVLHDELLRQTYLAQMMLILIAKRLESSWWAFYITIGRLLANCERVVSLIEKFNEQKEASSLSENDIFDDEIEEALENDEHFSTNDNYAQTYEYVIGKKKEIKLPEIRHLQGYYDAIKKDIVSLKEIHENLEMLVNNQQKNNGLQEKDEKLQKLIEIITEKQTKANPKVIVFTTYADTADYVYDQLVKRNFKKIAKIKGNGATFNGQNYTNFEDILDRFAPYTKLFKEKNWTHIIENNKNVSFEQWKTLITEDKNTLKKLNEPIDILISTDCLSEGQNLQDADMVINYDIHWNPVRLIQRMGRIDRIASPNEKVYSINFWPGESLDDYLKLRARIGNRLALMTISGSEVNDQISPEVSSILTEQDIKMYKKLEETMSDIETGENVLGFDDLSMEMFRQEHYEEMLKNQQKYLSMPNGIFSGFISKPFKNFEPKQGIIALLGTRVPNSIKHKELFLCYVDANGIVLQKNDKEILPFLKMNKLQERSLSPALANRDPALLQKYKELLYFFIETVREKQEEKFSNELFGNNSFENSLSNSINHEYANQNFDLIAWVEVNIET